MVPRRSPAERHQAVIPAQADAGTESASPPSGKEGEQRLLLHLPADGCGGIGALRAPTRRPNRDAPSTRV